MKLNDFTRKFKDNKQITSSYRRLIHSPPLQWFAKDIKNRAFKNDFENFISLLNNSEQCTYKCGCFWFQKII